MRTRVVSLCALAALILAWACIAKFGPWPHWMLPGPWAVGHALVETTRSGDLPRAIGTSLHRLFAGYLLSGVCGIALGLLMGRVATVRACIAPVVVGLQALPSICWLPLALLWFGLSEKAILFVVVMGSLLAITIATDGAVRAVPP